MFTLYTESKVFFEAMVLLTLLNHDLSDFIQEFYDGYLEYEVQHQYCVCGLACLVLKQMLKKIINVKKTFRQLLLKMCGLYIEFLTIKKVNCWQVGPEGYRDVTCTQKPALIFLSSCRTTPQKLFKKATFYSFSFFYAFDIAARVNKSCQI